MSRRALALLAVLAGACALPAEDHVAKASRFLADGKLDDARAEFRVALRRSRRPPEDLLWKMGLLDLDVKNLTQAREELGELVRRDPGSRERVARAYLLFAARWFEAGDAFTAIQAVEAARATDPGQNLGPFHYRVGDHYFELLDYERAAESYLLGLAMGPGLVPQARYRLAVALQRLGRWPQAVKHFLAYAREVAPETRERELSYHLGESAFRAAQASFLGHRYPEALHYLEIVLEAGRPESLMDDAYYLLGEVRFRRGDYAAAEEAFERVLQLSPSSSSRLYGEAERRLLDIRIGATS